MNGTLESPWQQGAEGANRSDLTGETLRQKDRADSAASFGCAVAVTHVRSQIIVIWLFLFD